MTKYGALEINITFLLRFFRKYPAMDMYVRYCRSAMAQKLFSTGPDREGLGIGLGLGIRIADLNQIANLKLSIVAI